MHAPLNNNDSAQVISTCVRPLYSFRSYTSADHKQLEDPDPDAYLTPEGATLSPGRHQGMGSQVWCHLHSHKST